MERLFEKIFYLALSPVPYQSNERIKVKIKKGECKTPHTDNKIDFFRPVLLQEIQGKVRELKRGVTFFAGPE
jgi:hypothetical protein